MSLKIQIATSQIPDWYYLVDSTPEQLEFLRTLPGARIIKNQLQIHKSLVFARNEEFTIVYDQGYKWFDYSNNVINPSAYAVRDKIARPYQVEDAQFFLGRSGGVMASETGVGKTLTAALAAELSGLKPVLVMGTLLSSQPWCSENGDTNKFFGIQPIHLQGRKNLDPNIFNQPNDGWWYCHYDILDAWIPWIFTRLRPRVAIFDEVHKTSPKAKRGKAALAISHFKEMRMRIVISATPVRNKRIDLWMPLELAAPDCVGDYFAFGNYFAGGQPNEHGIMTYDGETHNEELKARLKHLFIKRTKAEVMSYLPPIVRQGIEIELDNTAQEQYTKYKAAERDIRSFLQNFEGKALAPGINGERLIQLGKLLAILSRGKAVATSELAIDTANNTGKCVVFCWFKDVAKQIAEAIGKTDVEVYGPITGQDPVKVRIDQAKAFAASTEPAVYVATLASASESINELVAAQELIINDLYWNPLLLIQAEGRLHRGGQEGSVHVVYMVGKNTIDFDLLDMLYRKASAMETLGVDMHVKSLVGSIGGSAPDDDLKTFIKAIENEVQKNGYALDDEDEFSND
jgi:SWI/SNF-related matrix-associated actin-dependent regulator 1 of chromatin subfamily A